MKLLRLAVLLCIAFSHTYRFAGAASPAGTMTRGSSPGHVAKADATVLFPK
jgi:hypothetical protein